MWTHDAPIKIYHKADLVRVNNYIVVVYYTHTHTHSLIGAQEPLGIKRWNESRLAFTMQKLSLMELNAVQVEDLENLRAKQELADKLLLVKMNIFGSFIYKPVHWGRNISPLCHTTAKIVEPSLKASFDPVIIKELTFKLEISRGNITLQQKVDSYIEKNISPSSLQLNVMHALEMSNEAGASADVRNLSFTAEVSKETNSPSWVFEIKFLKVRQALLVYYLSLQHGSNTNLWI